MDAKADLSLRWAHTHFVGFVMSRLINNVNDKKDGVMPQGIQLHEFAYQLMTLLVGHQNRVNGFCFCVKKSYIRLICLCKM